MNVALNKPWTAEHFLVWAETQDEPYEFDGIRPVAMTGGNAGHDRITGNINGALRERLRGMSCSNYGPNLGIRTAGSAIRYPDALITYAKLSRTDKLAPDVVVVFEVVSPTSEALDHVEKLREYAGVATILRYVIVESSTPGLQVFHRENGGDPWSVDTLSRDEVLVISEVGVEIPVAEIYADVDFDETEAAG